MPRKKSAFDEIVRPLVGIFFLLLIYLFFKKSWMYLTVLVIAGFVVMFILLKYKNNQRNQFFQSQDTLESLRKLTPNQFEDYVAELFRRLGFRTEKVGGSYDGGIDVIAEKDGIKHYIQCKRFITGQVNVHDIRDFYGALVDKETQAKGYFITTNVFTLESEKFAEGKPLELIDGDRLMRYIKEAGVEVPESHAETCPRCGGMLQERHGKFGEFIGCGNYPKCKFTKPIQQV
ncbi:MAG: restriction endonuclease [Patescibacteria group bacterium]